MKGPFRHEFTAWFNGAAGFCDVRVFEPTEASGGLPIVMLTEPNDNDGPSVTNTVEQIAAEVLTRYTPEQDGFEPPFVLVEHYPDRQPRGKDARWHDPFFSETFDLVTFENWHLRRRVVRDRRLRLSFGTPDWKRVHRAEVEYLVSRSLPWPACTCQTKPSGELKYRGEAAV
jgi:hypothetical protein